MFTRAVIEVADPLLYAFLRLSCALAGIALDDAPSAAAGDLSASPGRSRPQQALGQPQGDGDDEGHAGMSDDSVDQGEQGTSRWSFDSHGPHLRRHLRLTPGCNADDPDVVLRSRYRVHGDHPGR